MISQEKMLQNETIDWNRCLHINGEITEDIVRSLVPTIFQLRQASNNPITISIDSSGGSIAAMDILLGLIGGPNQDKELCRIITVSVNQAFSAAANLLALGDYAVALPHSRILFHDIRYNGLQDVTTTKAKNAASRLKHANDERALTLANKVFPRLVWNYIDLHPKFEEYIEQYPDTYDKYNQCISRCLGRSLSEDDINLPGLLTSMYALVSKENEAVIENAVRNLSHWRIVKGIAKGFDENLEDGEPELLAASKNLFTKLRSVHSKDDIDDVWDASKESLQVIQTLLVEKIAKQKSNARLPFTEILESVREEFELIQSIENPSHYISARKLMLQHRQIFFNADALRVLDGDDREKRNELIENTRPAVQTFWYLCVLLCRSLFDGEHEITPGDAQVLGIVDEVAGGGPIESLREYGIKQVVRTKKKGTKST